MNFTLEGHWLESNDTFKEWLSKVLENKIWTNLNYLFGSLRSRGLCFFIQSQVNTQLLSVGTEILAWLVPGPSNLILMQDSKDHENGPRLVISKKRMT